MGDLIKLPPRVERGTLNRARWEVKYVPHLGVYTWCIEIPREPLRIADSAADACTAKANAIAAIRAYQKNKT